MQECHPERSEGSLCGERSFAALRMTKREGLVFEMSWPLWGLWQHPPLPSRRGAGGCGAGLGPLWPPAVPLGARLPILATPCPNGRPQGPPLHPTPLPPLRETSHVLTFSLHFLLGLMPIGYLILFGVKPKMLPSEVGTRRMTRSESSRTAKGHFCNLR